MKLRRKFIWDDVEISEQEFNSRESELGPKENVTHMWLKPDAGMIKYTRRKSDQSVVHFSVWSNTEREEITASVRAGHE